MIYDKYCEEEANCLSKYYFHKRVQVHDVSHGLPVDDLVFLTRNLYNRNKTNVI